MRERAGRQFLRFCAVGVSNTLVTLIACAALVELGVRAPLAGAAAFSLGAINGYALNRLWTFRARASWRSRVTYVAVQAVAVCANALALHLAVDDGGMRPWLAQALVLPPLTIASFLANRLVTFRGASTRYSSPATAEATATSAVSNRISPSSA